MRGSEDRLGIGAHYSVKKGLPPCFVPFCERSLTYDLPVRSGQIDEVSMLFRTLPNIIRKCFFRYPSGTTASRQRQLMRHVQTDP